MTATMLVGLNIDEYFQRSSSNGTFSYLTDMLGSTVALADSSGALDTTYTYDPFGNVTVNGADTNPYQFTGRENDGTGLYYYRARYYSPTFQRFIAQDPLGLGGGDSNLYALVKNDPATMVDRAGLSEAPAWANPTSADYNPKLVKFFHDLNSTDNPLLFCPESPCTLTPKQYQEFFDYLEGWGKMGGLLGGMAGAAGAGAAGQPEAAPGAATTGALGGAAITSMLYFEIFQFLHCR